MRNRRRIGELDKKVTIQKPGLVKDEYGDWVEGWEDWKKRIWASIEPAGGREFWQSEKFNSEATGEIHIRFQPEVKSNMRVIYKTKHGERIYNIEYFYHPKERKDRTVLIVKEMLESEVEPVGK